MWIAPLLAALFSLLPLQPLPPEGDTVLTVTSFNIRYGTADDGDNSWPNRDQLVISTIRNRDADIVGLQEALRFQLDEITEALPRYAVVGVGRDDGKTKGEYAAILYDAHRFAIDSSGTFWLSDTPGVVASSSWGNSITRICTWARLIDRSSGKAIYVFNAHLDHRSQPSREQSAVLIAQQINERAHPEDPALLMGDFNAGEGNPAIRYLKDDPNGPGFVHAYRTHHRDERDVCTFNGFTGETVGEMIDHIFVTDQLRVLDADIDRSNDHGRYPSDHFPVWARIGLDDG